MSLATESRLSKLIGLRSALRLEMEGTKKKQSSVAALARQFLGIEQRIPNETLLALLTDEINAEV